MGKLGASTHLEKLCLIKSHHPFDLFRGVTKNGQFQNLLTIFFWDTHCQFQAVKISHILLNSAFLYSPDFWDFFNITPLLINWENITPLLKQLFKYHMGSILIFNTSHLHLGRWYRLCQPAAATAAGIDTNNNQLKAAMAMMTGKATMVTAVTTRTRTEAAVAALTMVAQKRIN